jgi:uncharacterized protein involved in high-affinity Fe2+ transport
MQIQPEMSCPMSENSYDFDKKTTIGKWEVQIDNKAKYGYFEHADTGSGGGLWFESNELVDYDGVGVLPKKVIEAIKTLGFVVGDEFILE